ncbi:glycosyl-4,4'-diaponeurosporenoate acyltransferase [Anaerobranca gottschalkii]|nr:glycosyl-4,4'-diaponeurosporenoate acyltransferase [Anaerobranca gottschalkii]
MRIFYFSTATTIILNIFLWFIIHMTFGFFGNKFPKKWFEGNRGIYKSFSWEDEGRFYERVFKIKRWKKYLPDGGDFFSNGFAKKHLKTRNYEYLITFLEETRRAELVHWLQIIPVIIFFLFNLWWVGLIMVIYALAVNLPCIIAQRYNRPRLQKIIDREKCELEKVI